MPLENLNLNGYISAVQAAEIFGLTSDHVAFLVRKNKIEGALFGRVRYVKEESLKNYLAVTDAEKKAREEALSKQIKTAYNLSDEPLAVQYMPKQDTVVPQQKNHTLAYSAIGFALVCAVMGLGTLYASTNSHLAEPVASKVSAHPDTQAPAALAYAAEQTSTEPVPLPAVSQNSLGIVKGAQTSIQETTAAPVYIPAPAPVANLSAYVTQDVLFTQLDQLSNSLKQIIYAQAGASNAPASGQAGTVGMGQYSTGGTINNIALSNIIDKLDNVTINNASFTGSVSGVSASGLSGVLAVEQGGVGLTAAPSYGQMLIGNGSGGYSLVSTSTLGIVGGGGGTTYTFSYPLVDTASTVSLAFGTTTANTFSQRQTFTGGIIANASSTVGSGAQNGGLTVNGGATTTGNAYFASKIGIGTFSPIQTLDVVGSGRFSGAFTIGSVASCTGSQALQTDGSGTVSCGSISASGASTGGGWATNNVGKVSLATSTDMVVVGATSTPYAKLTVTSGSTATTTLVLAAVSGQTADIVHIYDQSGALTTRISASGAISASSLLLTTALGIASGGTGLAATPTFGQLLVGNGSGYTLTSTSSLGLLSTSSLSAVAPLAFNTTTGAFSISQSGIGSNGYLSQIDFNTFNNKISSTSLSAAYPLSYNSSTGVFATNFGTTTANTFSQLQTFTGGFLTNASSTLGNFTALNATTSQATTTSFAITSISNSILKTLTNGAVVAAIAGTDYITPTSASSSIASAYPFQVTGNATSTLTQFNGGLTAFASSTIGNGTQAGGLTINGGATTTGRFALGNGAFTVDDAAFLINRIAVNPLSNGGSHAVRDESIYQQASGSGGYASYDAIPTIAGSIADNHYHAFQARPNVTLAATISDVAGLTVQPTVGSGATITSSYGLHMYDALGTGTIGSQIGVWCEALTRGSSNYCLYNSGGTNNYLGTGTTQIGTGGTLTFGAGYSTYGAFLTHDASGNVIDNPNLTIVNGILTLAASTAKVLASATNLQLNSTSGNVLINPSNTTVGTFTPTGLLVNGTFLANASSTIGNGTQAGGLTINGGATTTGALSVVGNTTLANATSTSFAITSLTSCNSLNALTTNSLGSVVCGAISGSGSAYPFPLTGNATSSLTQFNAGLTAFASSTIGGGTQATGLTISGGATTTLNAYFGGKVSIGSTTPWAKLSIDASNLGASPAFAIGSSTATNFIVTNAGRVGVGTTTPAGTFAVNGSSYFLGATTTIGVLNPQQYANIRMVFAGDSRTDALGYDHLQDPTTMWGYILAHSDGFFGQATQYNYAVSGYTTTDVLNQFTAGVFRPAAPTQPNEQAYFFAWIGVNDMTNGTAATTVYANILSIWSQARALGYKVVAFTAGPSCSTAPVEVQMAALNQLIVSDPSKYDFLVSPDNIFPCAAGDHSTYFTVGVHPNAAGNSVLAQHVALTLRRAVGYYVADATVGTSSIAALNLLLNPGGNNVGIKTASPLELLSVNGSGSNKGFSVTYDSANYPNIRGIIRHIGDGATTGAGLQIIAQGASNTLSGSGDINFLTSSTNSANSTTDTTPTARLSIRYNGNVGVGTTTPISNFSVVGNGYFTGNVGLGRVPTSKLDVYDGNVVIKSVTSGTDRVLSLVNEGGTVVNLGVGTGGSAGGANNFFIETGAGYSLKIGTTGDATFTGTGGACVINGSGNCTSDARLKTNVVAISGTDALAGLAKINGVTYNWIDPSLDQSQRVGVIAQNVLAAFPQLVGTTTTTLNGVVGDYYTVNYAGLTAPLISAVNELNVRTQNLTNKVVMSSSSWTIATSSTSTPIVSISTGSTTAPASVSINGTLYVNGVDVVATVASSSATTTPEALVNGPFATAASAVKSALSSALAAIQNITQLGVRQLGAAVYASVGVFNNVFAQTVTVTDVNADTLNAKKLCLDGLCVTKDQLQSLMNGQSAGAGGGDTGSSSGSGTSSTTPPTVTLNGDNPATVQVGVNTYSDLGGVITGPGSDANLGLMASVDGAATTTADQIHIDTSVEGDHSIIYTATDGEGNVGYATRVVHVVSGN